MIVYSLIVIVMARAVKNDESGSWAGLLAHVFESGRA